MELTASLRASASGAAPVIYYVRRSSSCVSPKFSCVCSPSLRKINCAYAEFSARSFRPAHDEIRSQRTSGVKYQGLQRVLCSLEGEEKAAGVKPSSSSGKKSPFLKWTLLAAGVVVAGVVTYMRMKSGNVTSVVSDQGPAVQASANTASSFSIELPGFSLSLGEKTPGWVYFSLLMAAGFGLIVSEEALNVWVGASLARCLSYGSREAFFSSLSVNAPYIISTLLWVYCGVCISDMVPFYAGKLASKTGDQVRERFGVKKEQYEQVTGTVQRYGNLIGFVERFSVGVRNPTAFLAGVAGISPANFFVGVCLGGLITFPIQMSIGFMLRENPVAAIAGVAAVVGAWTVFPYAAAGFASMYYFLTRRTKSA